MPDTAKSIRLRLADTAEAPRLSAIAQAAKAHWGYPAAWLEKWRPQLTLTPETLRDWVVWVAEVDAQVVGFFALAPLGRRVRLEHLWVEPRLLRQGIGRALFERATMEAAQLGWDLLEIDSDPHAAGFYERVGAVRIGETSGDPESPTPVLPVFHFALKRRSHPSASTPVDILLATLNAKYIHAAFGLRYLLANLGDLRPRAAMAEFDINQKLLDIAEAILARAPCVLGLGIYIWNVTPATELVAILKRLRPELVIVLGGPEVSYDLESQEIVRLADHVVTGEADRRFAEVCRELLAGRGATLPKVIPAELPDLTQLALPYAEYGPDDVAHRVVYVEASRGCPFTCEFCLSSLEIPVRQFPLDRFLGAMQSLLDRGVRQFKFVDRTFNLHLPTSRAILRFFLERWSAGLFVHFEMVPDRLPIELRELIAQFPPGALQFEVGVQTLNPEVEARIGRRQHHGRLEDNLRWLRTQSGVHLHVDLIAGLPGETFASFAAGFDRLIALDPQEIQVGILKRLRGTPIVRHDAEWGMVYSSHPPYEILQTKTLDFATLARIRRFAKFWDLFGNSGNFVESRRGLLGLDPVTESPSSPCAEFLQFSDWLHAQGVKTSGVALTRQFELACEYLVAVKQFPFAAVQATLARDYRRPGRSDLRPAFFGGGGWQTTQKSQRRPAQPLPARQARHAGASN